MTVGVGPVLNGGLHLSDMNIIQAAGSRNYSLKWRDGHVTGGHPTVWGSMIGNHSMMPAPDTPHFNWGIDFPGTVSTSPYSGWATKGIGAPDCTWVTFCTSCCPKAGPGCCCVAVGGGSSTTSTTGTALDLKTAHPPDTPQPRVVQWCKHPYCPYKPPPPPPSLPPPPSPVAAATPVVISAAELPSMQQPPLPPIPDQVWFGMWASDAASHSFSSVVWDSWNDTAIEQQGGPELRFLYQVGSFFCSFDGNKTWTFYPDYQTRWNRAVPKLRRLLQQQNILGFMIGDESVDKGLSTDHWETIIQTIRATFPRGTAIIWASDWVCSEANCTSHGKPCHCIEHIPPALDWISSAIYRTNSSSGFIGSVRASYENHIFPKLQPHQKVAVIPQVVVNDGPCDDQCMARIELQDAKDSVAWARNDSRVALIAPYLWRSQGCDGQDCDMGLKEVSGKGTDELRQYWEDFGRSTKHAKWSE